MTPWHVPSSIWVHLGPWESIFRWEKPILPYFSGLSMVAILVCDSHRQAGSSTLENDNSRLMRDKNCLIWGENRKNALQWLCLLAKISKNQRLSVISVVFINFKTIKMPFNTLTQSIKWEKQVDCQMQNWDERRMVVSLATADVGGPDSALPHYSLLRFRRTYSKV